ncbi:MAG: WG repeat-containing protein, partial [Steroidobacteraceae bacterium]
FSGRLAAVFIGEEETGEWGYIDKLGKIVIRPQFGEAHSFSEAMAAVRIGTWKTGKWGYIGK